MIPDTRLNANRVVSALAAVKDTYDADPSDVLVLLRVDPSGALIVTSVASTPTLQQLSNNFVIPAGGTAYLEAKFSPDTRLNFAWSSASGPWQLDHLKFSTDFSSSGAGQIAAGECVHLELEPGSSDTTTFQYFNTPDLYVDPDEPARFEPLLPFFRFSVTNKHPTDDLDCDMSIWYVGTII